MKKVLLIIALVAGGLVVKAQSKEEIQRANKSAQQHASGKDLDDPSVPAKAKSELKSKYPEVTKSTNVRWEKDDQNYEANFTSMKKEYEVKFDSKGNWVSTTIEKGTAEELPQKVKDAISKGEFKTWQVKEVETKEMPGKTTYKVEVKSGIKTKELTVDKDGTIVKTENKMM